MTTPFPINKPKGLTLVEILAVLIILGILAALAVPLPSKHSKAGKFQIAILAFPYLNFAPK